MCKNPAEGKNDRGKRRILSGKCLMVVLMVAVMAVSCFVLINDSVDSSASLANTIYVSDRYGTMQALSNNGDPYIEYDEQHEIVEAAEYAGGVLTLTDFNGSSYNGAHTENGVSAAIYCAGDLTLVLKGGTSGLTFRVPDGGSIYGIYVTGNLTIRNQVVDTNTSLNFDLSGRKASVQSAGIYCSGKLTVINESNNIFTLNAKGAMPSFDSGSGKSSFKTYGILCGSADFNKMGSSTYENVLNVTAIGGDISVSPQSGTVESTGLKSNNGAIDVEGNTSITAIGGKINISGYTNNEAVISAGIYSATALSYNPTSGNRLIKATGGDIFMESNSSTYGKGGISYGIYAGNMSAGGKITATGGTVPLGLPAGTSNSYGIWTTSFTGDHATITATASDATRVSCGFLSTGGFDSGEGSTITCNGGAAPSNIAGTYSAGLSCLDYVGGDGSDVTATSGIVCYYTSMTAGVKVSTIELNGNAKLTGFGGDTRFTFKPTKYDNSSNTVTTGASAASTYGIYITGNSVEIKDTSILTGTGRDINSGEMDPNAVTAGIYFEHSSENSIISGTGSIGAHGGTVAYSTSDYQWNVSAGIYALRPLIINKTDIVAEGNTVCTEDDAPSASRGSRSYGLYAESLSILGGSEVSAAGGANGCYSSVSTAPKYNDSIGIYVTNGDLSISEESTLTATGKDSQRIIGIIVNGNVTVNGGSTITVNVPANVSQGYIDDFDGIGMASIGIYLSNDTSSFSVPSGTVIVSGTSQAIKCTGSNTNTFSIVEALWTSDSLTGEGATIISSSTNIADVSSVYVKMDNSFNVVFNGGWTYGDDHSGPEFSNLSSTRVVSVTYTGEDVFGDTYDTETVPENAGSYRVTIVYDFDNVKTFDFEITPRTGGTILSPSWSPPRYTGEVLGPDVTRVRWKEAGETTELDSREYRIIADPTAISVMKDPNETYNPYKNPYTATIILDKNYQGEYTLEYRISQQYPEPEMFVLPEIGTVGYKGEPITLHTPTLKSPMEGCGNIIIKYGGSTEPPTAVGRYTIAFDVEGGPNFVARPNIVIGQLVIAPHTVSFDGNGAEGTMSDVTNAAGAYTLPANGFTVPTGKVFSKWAAGSAEGTQYAAGTEYNVVSDITFYAIWEDIVYDITFLDDDGETVLQRSSLLYGATPVYSGTPTKAADAQYTYIFAGWDPEIVAVTGNATYTATYSGTLRTYTIIWKSQDGNTILETDEEVPYGTQPDFNLEEPTKANTPQYTYAFVGWATEANKTTGLSDDSLNTVTGDVVYYAAFSETVNTYTVTWYSQDGTGVLKTDLNVPYGDPVSFDGSEPTKTNTAQYTYTFAGWATEANKTTGTPVGSLPTVSGDADYYAAFSETVNKYTITFVDDDGVTVLQSSSLQYGATPVYSGTPTKYADAQYTYTFTGWSPEIVTVTCNATYTATYSGTLRTYTVTWYSQSGTVLETDLNVPYGDPVSFGGSEPTKDNTDQYTYAFVGWATEANKTTGTPVGSLPTVSGDADYYAAFSETVNTFTVTLTSGTGYVIEPQTGSVSPVEYGGDFSFTVAYATGYEGDLTVRVNGAQLDPVAGVYTISDITENKTVTVTGAQLKKLTVTFNRNGGTGEMIPQTVDYNTPAVLTLNAFERYGYNFTGWNTNYGGTGTAYADGAEITITENITLYARWSPKVLTITLDPNDGTVSPTSLDVTYDTNYELPTPLYSGHNFAGWWIESVPEQLISNSGKWTVRANDVTLVAHWTVMTVYNMTFSGGAGSEGSMGAMPVIQGENFTLPGCTFTKEGYHFYKWSCNAIEYDAGHTIEDVTSDMEFLALWEGNMHTVTVHYVYLGGTPVREDIVQEHRFGTDYAIYSDILAGYTADKTVVSGTMPDGNIEVTVTYFANQHKITFDCAGGEPIAQMVKGYGEAILAPIAVRTGYDFAGWEPALPATMPDNDLSVVAKWVLKPASTDGDKIEFITEGDSAVIDTGSISEALADATKKSLEISGNGWTMAIPKEIISGATGQVSVSAQKLDDAAKAALPAAIKERVQGKTVFSLDLSDSNGKITFTGKKITVSLPYTLAAGESADNVKVFCINGENLEEFDATYDSEKKVAVFETEHFSDWFVDVVKSPSGSNGGGFPIWIIFVIIAVVAVGGGAFFFISKKKA